MKAKLLLISSLAVMATASQAVIFITNLQFSSGFAGGSISSAGNSVSFSASAAVGDTLPSRYGIITYQYDARSNQGPIIGITLNFGGDVRGSGVIRIQEDVYKLDLAGNEIGGIYASFTATSAPNAAIFAQTNSFTLTDAGSRIRVKKTIVLDALPNTQGPDIAALAYVNQSVEAVPEPATLAVLGLGLSLIARRRKSA